MTVHATWHVATVVGAERLTANARLITLDVPSWPGNEAGQHADIRLTAEDGYQATRSYSIASAGGGTQVELAVDRVENGEVSPYLVEALREGDQLELHGPLGGWFVWAPSEDRRPVLLVAGGSGVVPFVAMLRAHAAAEDRTPMRLLYGLRAPDDLFFSDELQRILATDPAVAVDYVFSRRTPEGSQQPPGRISLKVLAHSTVPPSERPRLFVCGSTGFVETVISWLIELGHPAKDIHAERFGGI